VVGGFDFDFFGFVVTEATWGTGSVVLIPPPPPDGGSVGPGGLAGGDGGFGVAGAEGFGDFEVLGGGFGARGGAPPGVSATWEIDVRGADCEASWAVPSLPGALRMNRPVPLLATTFAREIAFLAGRAWVEPVGDG
jgi:hypothetical protein